MKITITPGPLSGTAAAPPSKSDLHRILICAAFADSPTEIRVSDTVSEEIPDLPEGSASFLSGDIAATIECLKTLGAKIEVRGSRILVRPVSAPGAAASASGCIPVLDCGESGSTLRFLLPVAASYLPAVTLTGRGRLPERPLGGLILAMQKLGFTFSGTALPLTVYRPAVPAAKRTELPGNVSSQYLTGLLLAAPLLGLLSIRLTTPLASADYVNMTIDTMRRFGVPAEQSEDTYTVPFGMLYRSPGKCAAEGDWSNAAVFLAARQLTEKRTGRAADLEITGLSGRSRQGDRAILDLLPLFEEKQTDGKIRTIDVTAIPDLVPVLSVLAAASDGVTRITGAARLRFKESDRLAACADLLHALGGCAEVTDDGLLISGTSLRGGTVDPRNDHRIAMAAALASIVCAEPVTIPDAECVRKSYPGFFDDFRILAGQIEIQG